ncbi:MAG TPA: dTMP kinase [Chloroflexota bacterium]|nr:dTMP kinase [Chloroflexota bacterium]
MTVNGEAASQLPDGSPRVPLQRLDHPGSLIIVEGVDGSGKSTQLQLLLEWLVEQGADVLFTEWNSSSLTAKAVRRGKRRLWLGNLSFVVLHATDFTHRYENIILPALRAGKLVLADRYVFTAFARDVARNADRTSVRRLYSFALQPDLPLYFRVPLDVAMNRVLTGPGREGLKFYEAGLDLGLSRDPEQSYRLFQGRVVHEYDRMIDEYGLTVIDANRPIEPQREEVRELARPILEQHLELLAQRQENRRTWRELVRG